MLLIAHKEAENVPLESAMWKPWETSLTERCRQRDEDKEERLGEQMGNTGNSWNEYCCEKNRDVEQHLKEGGDEESQFYFTMTYY